jgi:transposase
VRTLADFLAEVDPPEEGPVEPVEFEDRLARPFGVRVVAAASRLVKRDVILYVAVQIARRRVVGTVIQGRL